MTRDSIQTLRTNGQEPIPGYASIGLYVDDHLVRSYSIRVETGDVVDAMSCTIFRYPDLLSVKQKLQRGFGTKDVSVDQISSEVGCNELKVLNHKTEKPIK